MYSQNKTFLVNSRNKISGTDNNFTYNFNENLSEYDSVVCIQASIPKSFWIIETGINDTFILTEGITNYTITLSPGNYNNKNMALHLQTVLNAAGAYTYTCTYPVTVNDKGFFSFSSTGGDPTFTFSSNSPYEQIGFNIGSISFSGGVLYSENVINLQKEGTVRILCDACDQNILCNVLASNTGDFNAIQYRAIDIQAQTRQVKGRNTTCATFSIVNEDNKLINLHGQNCVIEVMFYKNIIKDFWESSKMLKGYIKYQLLKDESNNNNNNINSL